eukprot:3822191-Rhodomonas_salina.1
MLIAKGAVQTPGRWWRAARRQRLPSARAASAKTEWSCWRLGDSCRSRSSAAASKGWGQRGRPAGALVTQHQQ